MALWQTRIYHINKHTQVSDLENKKYNYIAGKDQFFHQKKIMFSRLVDLCSEVSLRCQYELQIFIYIFEFFATINHFKSQEIVVWTRFTKASHRSKELQYFCLIWHKLYKLYHISKFIHNETVGLTQSETNPIKT